MAGHNLFGFIAIAASYGSIFEVLCGWQPLKTLLAFHDPLRPKYADDDEMREWMFRSNLDRSTSGRRRRAHRLVLVKWEINFAIVSAMYIGISHRAFKATLHLETELIPNKDASALYCRIALASSRGALLIA
ncbi:hypothetical protein CTAYLR_003186, partial [Chrysophaeum taylorii]